MFKNLFQGNKGAGTSASLKKAETRIISTAKAQTTTSAAPVKKYQPVGAPGASPLHLQSQRVGFSFVNKKERDQEALGDTPDVQSRTVTDMQYRRFSQFIEEQSGIVLGQNKQYLVNSRLASLLLRFKCSTIDELINKAMDPTNYRELSSAVVDAMTTNETL